jgi:uncharacterized protein
MSMFVRAPNSRKNRKAAVVAAIVAASAALNAVITGSRSHGRVAATGGGDIGSTTTILMYAGVIMVPVAIFLVLKLVRKGDDDSSGSDDMSNNTGSSTEEDERDQRPFGIILALVAALIAIAFGIFAWTEKAQAQGAPDRGAFVVLNGADTLVVDKFTRTADTIRGSVAMKGAARVDYVIALGPDNTLRTLAIKQFKWGAAPDDAPTAQVLTTMQSDTAIFQMAASSARIGTKAGAVPSFGNAFALGELFTRRARSAGGTGDYWYLAINGGVTIPVAVRSVGSDSMTVTLGGQVERFKVDEMGRVLGGTIAGQPVVIKRVGESEAAKINFGSVPLKAAEKPDYSAPRGAPYSAEEVTFKGPGGITLGGTLTKPLSARGPLPAVVTITGSGQEDRDEFIPFVGGVRLFRQVADTLSRVGIAVLRLDDRGLGASTGDFAASNTADFADDTRAALAYLRSRADIDPRRLALVGHSEGGMIAPMVAATDPALKAIAIFAGPADKMLDIIMQQNKWALDHNPNMTQAQRDSTLGEARLLLAPERQFTPALKFWMSYDPAVVAKQVKTSTLILQGETDRQVPAGNATKLAAIMRAGGNKDVTVRIFPSTDHLFLDDPTGDFSDMYKHVKTNKISPAILGAMSDWLVAKIGTQDTTTLQYMQSNGVVIHGVMFGQPVDLHVTYKDDGTSMTKIVGKAGKESALPGKWRSDGDKLCTTNDMNPLETCIVLPPGKKPGDAFNATTPGMGEVTITINK